MITHDGSISHEDDDIGLNDDKTIDDILEFYATECDPIPLLGIEIPKNDLIYDDMQIRTLFAYSPLFTADEKVIIIEQFPYLTQYEFDDIINEILDTHAEIRIQLERINTAELQENHLEALKTLKEHL